MKTAPVFLVVFLAAGCPGATLEGVDGGAEDAETADGPATDTLAAADASTGPAEYLDEVYRSVDGDDLTGDLRVPEGPGPFATVVLIHGGVFTTGDKADMAVWAPQLSSHGLASFAVNYRLRRDFAAGAQEFPKPVQDVKCAVQWLRANASRFRLDAARILVLGSSAGGYFAEMIGASGDDPSVEPSCQGAEGLSNRVSGAVAYFGISDWVTLADERGLFDPEAQFVGSNCTTDPDRAGICTEASPVAHLGLGTSPFFVLHSDDDPAIPVAQSRELRDRLSAAGLAVEYRELTGKGHGWATRWSDPDIAAARDEVLAWLRERAQ